MQRKRFGSPQPTTSRNDNYEPCIRLTNVHRIPRVSRHLDDILTTLEAIIGKVAYMHTYRRSTHNSPTTSVFIQLFNIQSSRGTEGNFKPNGFPQPFNTRRTFRLQLPI